MMLDGLDIIFASLLVGVALLISWRLRLNLGKSIIIASIRTIVQLSFVGLILAWVFAQESSIQVLSILSVMTLIASHAVSKRIKKPYRGLFLDTVLSLAMATTLVVFTAMLLILNIKPWYSPQYIIPIAGLILGNSLTAVSLTSSQMIDDLYQQSTSIRMMLALSATPFEACHHIIVKAINHGMMPTINSMMVVGLVSLPGMMTGQILAGADPSQAVRYQIITMFFICTGSALSCTIISLLILKRFFNKNNQLIL